MRSPASGPAWVGWPRRRYVDSTGHDPENMLEDVELKERWGGGGGGGGKTEKPKWPENAEN